jgi:hypothetical protein
MSGPCAPYGASMLEALAQPEGGARGGDADAGRGPAAAGVVRRRRLCGRGGVYVPPRRLGAGAPDAATDGSSASASAIKTAAGGIVPLLWLGSGGSDEWGWGGRPGWPGLAGKRGAVVDAASASSKSLQLARNRAGLAGGS